MSTAFSFLCFNCGQAAGSSSDVPGDVAFEHGELVDHLTGEALQQHPLGLQVEKEARPFSIVAWTGEHNKVAVTVRPRSGTAIIRASFMAFIAG